MTVVNWAILVSGLIGGLGPVLYILYCLIRYPEARKGTIPPGNNNIGNGANVSL